MIEEKQSLNGKIANKENISGGINVGVEYIEPTTQEKTIEPTTEQQIVTPDENIFALSKVIVEPVTSAIDSNIQSENIKEGIEVLGVVGTFEGKDPSDVNINDYFYDTISAGTSSLANETGWIKVLKKFPETLTIEGTSAEYMFYYYPLSEIPDIDFSEVTNMQSVFSRSKITSLKLNVPNATSLNGCCDSCTLLTNLEINSTNLNTNLGRLVYQCTSLVDLSELEGGGVTSIYNIVYRCNNLTNFKGVKNLGESYRTSQNANYTYYTFDLSPCTALTEESLISILNNLYDIATRGCNTQSCILGATNLAKLTSEEGQTALTNAQTKGWTLS